MTLPPDSRLGGDLLVELQNPPGELPPEWREWFVRVLVLCGASEAAGVVGSMGEQGEG